MRAGRSAFRANYDRVSIGAPELLVIVLIGCARHRAVGTRHLDGGRREPLPGLSVRAGGHEQDALDRPADRRHRRVRHRDDRRRDRLVLVVPASRRGCGCARRHDRRRSRIGSGACPTTSDRSASRFPKRCSTTCATGSARTRWPDQIPGSGWDYGTDLAYLQDLCEHWRTKFDWRAQEDAVQPLAALPHRHRRPAGPLHPRALAGTRRVAAVITHGWPGSVAEFLDIIEPLATRAHGGDPRTRSTSSCPSLPGLRLVGPDDANPAGTCSASPKRGRR